jgi:hypothetical protein
MTLNDIRQLNNGSKVLARFAKRDNEDGDAPDWGEPKVVSLYVLKAEKDYKKGKKIIRPMGSIIELAVNEFGWASYEEDDFCEEYNEFLVEEYRMQILEILKD